MWFVYGSSHVGYLVLGMPILTGWRTFKRQGLYITVKYYTVRIAILKLWNFPLDFSFFIIKHTTKYIKRNHDKAKTRNTICFMSFFMTLDEKCRFSFWLLSLHDSFYLLFLYDKASTNGKIRGGARYWDAPQLVEYMLVVHPSTGYTGMLVHICNLST